jgi:hypothetical protein
MIIWSLSYSGFSASPTAKASSSGAQGKVHLSCVMMAELDSVSLGSTDTDLSEHGKYHDERKEQPIAALCSALRVSGGRSMIPSSLMFTRQV